ncbi:hypothetical protein PGT21_024882 [Puccinia graminis f. sp. tritici]|uniref:Alcohol dehydrogenase-like N-terminal domain-containing protein n=1 Tax=Puccinia graminis f. sp. tritici TaxID=56615 RepID=A0A5B0ME83_PUCGR|nr:hypothetical protein PGT21_024882 [Puccinia graminis f. sp. tritici]
MDQAIMEPTFISINKALYDPRIVLDSEEFEILNEPAQVQRYSESNKNIACCYNEKKQILMVKKPMPKLHPGQVLLRIRATGICGSDVHFWKHAGVGKMVVKHECGAGHESAGEIIGVGEGVADVKVGDRVAIEAGVPCSKPTCEMCRTGRYNACPDVVFFSTPPYHGLLTRFHAHPACWVHKLPLNVSFEEGALLEPLAVALASVEHAGVKLGDPVLICGAGPIGLVTLLACQAAGACPIAITDISESRLDFAKRTVPSVSTFRVTEGVSEVELGQQIQHLMGEKPQVALECTGRQSSVRTAIFFFFFVLRALLLVTKFSQQSVKFGGKVFMIGCGQDEQLFPHTYMFENQIDVQFQFRYANQYPKAIKLVSSGLINVKPLVTHRFPLQEAVEAFHTSANPESGSIKVQIVDI